MGLDNENSCSLKLKSDSSQVSQILIHFDKYDNELEGCNACQNLLSIIVIRWIPVSIHITMLGKVAVETNHLESLYDENKSLVEMLLNSVPFCPSCVAQVQQMLSLCYINYVVLNNKLKKATALKTLRKKQQFFRLSITLHTWGKAHDLPITRLRQCPLQWTYVAYGASLFICACMPDVLDDMLLAPLYPWPCMPITGMLFSFRKAGMFSAIFSPVIFSSLIT